jgi:hypothetical protein
LELIVIDSLFGVKGKGSKVKVGISAELMWLTNLATTNAKWVSKIDLTQLYMLKKLLKMCLTLIIGNVLVHNGYGNMLIKGKSQFI